MSMAKLSENRSIGSCALIEERGTALRFEVKQNSARPGSGDEVIPAFVVQFDHQYYAYINRCGHIAVQLDFRPGDIFSDDGTHLMCSTHGALYEPTTGACTGGPCFGVGLEQIEIFIEAGIVYLNDARFTLCSSLSK